MANAKVNKVAKKLVEDGKVVFAFMNGVDVVCDPKELPPAIIEELIIYGIKQKVGDKYAKCEGVTDAVLQAEHVWENLKAGIFNEKGGGNGNGGYVVEAMARYFSIGEKEALEAWRKKDEAERKVFKTHPDIQLIILQIKTEIAAEKLQGVDASSFDTLTLPTL